MIAPRIPDEARRILDQAKSSVIAAGYEYWLRARDRSGQSLPGRQHLDPVEMKDFLPHVVLVDVVRDGAYQRFRSRLNGTHVTDIFDRDGTGKYIEHIGYLHVFDEFYRRFSAVVDEKALVYGISSSPARHFEFGAYEHLTLPLASDGHTIDMLFGVRCALPHSDAPVAHEFVVAPLIDHANLAHL